MLVWVKKYWVKIGKKCYNKRSKFPSVLFSNRNLTQCQKFFFNFISRAIHAEQYCNGKKHQRRVHGCVQDRSCYEGLHS